MNLGEMISLFRNYVNERPYVDDTAETAVFWQRKDIIEYINRSLVMYNAFINDLDESFNIELKNYAVNASLTEDGVPDNCIYVLPDNIQKVKLVEFYSSAADNFGKEVKPINIVEKFRVQIVYPYRYYLRKNNIILQNQITGLYKLRLYYLRIPQMLLADVDVPELPEQAHENIVIDAVAQGLARDKQTSLANYWLGVRADRDKKLSNYLTPRIASEPNTVLARADWETGLYGVMYGF